MGTQSIKGTRTEQNLVNAYLSESSAYTRYIYYAKKANKEGYFPVERIFKQTADNELHHGKVFFGFLQGGKVTVPMDIDAGMVDGTVSNLAIAIAEEAEEVEFYNAAAKTAEEEGFDEIASHFRAIATVEAHHQARFERFKHMIDNGTLWKREKPVTWECLVCGYQILACEPPKVCPGCDHPYQHYIAIGDDEL